MISPAMSLLKMMELPTPRSRVPVSWSPLVKTMTSGGGLGAGVWARAAMVVDAAMKMRRVAVRARDWMRD